MAKRLIPTLYRVLVEKILPPSKTTSGILLPKFGGTQVNLGEKEFLLYRDEDIIMAALHD